MAEGKKLIIYGAGGLGKEVKALVDSINKETFEWDFVGFVDDGKTHESVLGGLDILKNYDQGIYLVVAIGSPKTKFEVTEKISVFSNIHYATLVHPGAIIMDQETVKLGEGTIVTAGVVLTTEILIGNHVLLNLNSTVGHNAVIGDCCSLMPGVNVAGGVIIDDQVLVGSGANILNGLKIGKGAKVGSGAVVLDTVKAGDTVVGVPAKIVK
ncbi:acetyltransferase [Fulvivirga sp.]|uniref:acetyltransferase n=1 Tax=Fulvivirga sp. TaxID=1931237 RepID=UPI0032EFC54A